MTTVWPSVSPCYARPRQSVRPAWQRTLCALALMALATVPALAQLAPAPVKAMPLLKTDRSWDGSALAYPAGAAEVTALLIEVAPGAETGWHHHPVPSFAYLLEGELEIRLRTGQSRRVTAGQAVAEVVDTAHNGRNPGTVPTRLVVFYIGTPSRPITVNESAR